MGGGTRNKFKVAVWPYHQLMQHLAAHLLGALEAKAERERSVDNHKKVLAEGNWKGIW
jgi:hypothetical protein